MPGKRDNSNGTTETGGGRMTKSANSLTSVWCTSPVRRRWSRAAGASASALSSWSVTTTARSALAWARPVKCRMPCARARSVRAR